MHLNQAGLVHQQHQFVHVALVAPLGPIGPIAQVALTIVAPLGPIGPIAPVALLVPLALFPLALGPKGPPEGICPMGRIGSMGPHWSCWAHGLFGCGERSAIGPLSPIDPIGHIGPLKTMEAPLGPSARLPQWLL